ncbi:MAG TPA: phosphoglycerate mutase family protein [Flavisolibacter sp.]|nr:phosphoglycerate mutase family protein [Flavisolibacter sp.]
MKTLLVVRHAKSSWERFDQPDIERPLNDRGKKDAPEMAQRLKEKNIKVDLFVSSPAKRAKKTAKLFAEEYKVDKDDILIREELYEPRVDNFYNVAISLPDKANVIALFSHNPGITEFVNTLTNVRIDDMPTCGIFAVSADTDNWSEFKEASKQFLFFDYPKNPLT